MKLIRWLSTNSGSIAWFFFPIFFDKLKEALQENVSMYWAIGFCVLVGTITLFLKWFGNKLITPNIEAESIRDRLMQGRRARKGLVVFLSLYQNFKKNISEEELSRCIRENDYESLEIADTSATNFGHAINAIKANLKRLKHLWIVTTERYSSPTTDNLTFRGTSDYLSVFKEFLVREVFGDSPVAVHCSPDLNSIEMDEDSAICKKTSDLIQEIYLSAKNSFGLKPSDIIVDATGGLTSMKIGAVLASLRKDQCIEIIGSEYDKKTGKPISGDKSFPVVIGFNPAIQRASSE